MVSEGHLRSSREAHRRQKRNSQEAAPKKAKSIDDQPWYHGLLRREDIEELLKKEGDFLVRTSPNEKGFFEYVLSIMGPEKICHYKIHLTTESKFTLAGEKFDSVCELVLYFYSHGKSILPGKNLALRRGVKPPRWLIRDKQIVEEGHLGHGAFGEVVKGRYHDQDNSHWRTVAIKKCKLAEHNSDLDRNSFLTEARIMLNFRHENLVSLFGVVADSPPIRLVIEFCPAGSLDSHLKKNKDRITKGARITFCLQAAQGMNYLAGRKVVHRDLAARNCLLGEGNILKIGDFGMAIVEKGREKPSAKIPVRWTAPEAMQKKDWSTKSDVFSFGVLMWEIYSDADLPWGTERTNQSIRDAVLDGKTLGHPVRAPLDTFLIMKRCWEWVKDSRPDFASLIADLAYLKRSTSTDTQTQPDRTQNKTPSNH